MAFDTQIRLFTN